MKTYEEMAKYVLEVRDKHDKKINHRKAVIKRTVPVIAGLCCTLIIAFGIWKGHIPTSELPNPDNIIIQTTTSATVTELSQTTYKAVTTLTATGTDTSKTTAKTAPASTAVTAAQTTSQALSRTDAAVQTTGAAIATTVSSEKTSSYATSSTSASVTAISTATATLQTTSSYTSTAVTLTFTSPTSMERTTVSTSTVIVQTTRAAGNDNGGGNNGGGSSSGGESDIGGINMGGGSSGGGNSGGGGCPWLFLPVNQKYDTATLDGYKDTYLSTFRISPDDVSGYIGTAVMQGFDPGDDEFKYCSADAYYVKNIAGTMAFAVRFAGYDGYYLYRSVDTSPEEIRRFVSPAE